ncbi:hypothetical protein CPB84DRAFT_1795356 [Gymnopilus junonius]|uniref:Uncharacterized protein n=1 Tax=Gymnopilus junonius TaxID=109634 RepID=A0A9P5N9T9_GYMJU|nr:hypothetical protein CPB84DRAFT_1795356 [Gymnopilus junonius]
MAFALKIGRQIDVAQPRARLEDLVRVYGVREGVVSVPEGYHENESQDMECSAPRLGPSSSTSNPANPTPAPASKTRRSFFSFGSKKPSSDPPPTQTKIQIQPIPFPSLSISFSPRQVGLVLNRSRTIVEVPRRGTGRNRETLEVLARALVGELKVALGG